MKTKLLITSALLAASIAVPSALAADKFWDGGAGNGTWTAPINWVGDAAPVPTDSLFFAGSVQPSTNNGFTANTQFNGLTFNAGASSFTLAGNAINLAGNITNSSSNNQTISLALALQQNITVDSGGAGLTTSLTGALSGSSSLTKTGAGRLFLSANNASFSGGLLINEGRVQIRENNSTGTGTYYLGATGGAQSAELSFIYNRTLNNTLVVSSGAGARSLYTGDTNAGDSTLGGRVILQNDLNVYLEAASSLYLSGQIFGDKTIFVNGGSVAAAKGAYMNAASRNSFLGTVQVNSGSALLSNSMNISGATVNLGSGGTLDMRSQSVTVGGLVGSAGSIAKPNSGTQILTLVGSGNYTFGGEIANGLGINQLWVTMNYGGGKGGVQTLSGANTFTGTTTVDSGKLVLDYTTSNSTKLSNSNNLIVHAGTIELVGGDHVEVVAGLTLSASTTPGGMVNFVRSSGNSVLQLATLNYGNDMTDGGGAINFSTNNMATTTSGVFNGLLGSNANSSARLTVGGSDWATKSGDNIVAFNAYSDFVQSGGANTNNYVLNGGSSLTGDVSFYTLKIASSTGSAQTLALGNRTLGLSKNGLLVTGSDNYAITADAGFGPNNVVIHNYSTGTLTLGPTRGVIDYYGTGKMLLTGASTAPAVGGNNPSGFRMASGTVEFSNNNQLAGSSANTTLGDLLLFGGNFVANTTGGNISLTKDTAFRGIRIGSDVPVIEVIGGGTLTIAGVVDRAFANPFQYSASVVFGSERSSAGTIVLSGSNTYNGDTRLDGIKLSVNSATSLGLTSVNTKLVFSRNSTLNTTANIATSRYYDINSGVTGTIETDASTTLTHNGTIAGAGNLRKTGAGTLTINGTSTYTGSTTISAGTLLLNATGTIASSSGVNLGTVGSQGTLDITAKTAYTFGTSQTVSGYGLINIGTGKTVTIAGTLAPGNSAGITSVTGGLLLSSSANTTMELGGLTVGSGYDRVAVSEAMAYSGALTIVSYNGWDINQVATYDLFNFSSYSGNFTTVAVGGFALTFDNIKTYTGNNGGTTYTFTLDNGVLAVVPEPAAWMLLTAAGTFFMVMRRRRSD
jgi:autotransporter-associated beta strand protein